MNFHVRRVFPSAEPTLTHTARTTTRGQRKASQSACTELTGITLARNNLTMQNWPHSLPFQQFQALLTLFSKSFSSFPHGTCLLSVSSQCLASDEIYHPVCAPISRNVTLRMRAVHGGLRTANGIITLSGALFQEAYIRAFAGDASRDYNSKPQAPISTLSSSLFIRHY